MKALRYCYDCKQETTFTEKYKPDGYYDYEQCDSCDEKTYGAEYFDRKYSSYIYKQQCECKKVHTILSIENNDINTQTLTLFCSCGRLINFELPIND